MTDFERPPAVWVSRCIAVDRGHVMIIQRTGDDTHNPDKWEFPGGKFDFKKKYPIETTLESELAREVFEETGFEIEVTSTLNHRENYIIQGGKYDGLPYVVSFNIGRVIGGEVNLDPTEVSDLAWPDYEEAFDYDLTNSSRRALQVLGSYILSADF
jgi:8-oxo-dGTP pyrophosphatase MutT (NUDIX family)